ncbi:taste receptor type 1 member 3 [Brienomyrus brachyistius]|uniref:taste receptor type 1 member 3 n=1 Tax=Brienomyrus brachyistius TaxID=42636 RepID=UPI0020B235A0|nr:taste receptor type 1 member 3 [Brienomyrus brachyistius]
MGLLVRLVVLYWVLRLDLCENEPAWFQNISTSIFNSSGDFLLGGLFPINGLTSNLSQNENPSDVQCNSVNAIGLGLSLVMKYTVDEINSTPDLLPDIKLGFETFDTCSQSFIIVKPSMFFLSEGYSGQVRVMCNYTEYSTRVLAVIGPQKSEMVDVVGKLFGFFMMPQISYGATCNTFSDKQQYPSFLRTVPSNQWQAQAIVDLLKEFGWNWVAVLGSGDDYGKEGQLVVSMLAAQYSICVAYEAIIPVYDDPQPMISEILDNIKSAAVGVVVLFTAPSSARIFFSEVIKRNMVAVWVASSAWSLDNLVYELPNINRIGTVLGFTENTQMLTSLTSYARVLLTRLGKERGNGLRIESDKSGYSHLEDPCPDCWNLSQDNISIVTQPVVQRKAFSVYLAVYSAAHALHQVLGCNTTSCQKGADSKVYPWQLLEVLKNMSFEIKGQQFHFDSNGNPNIGYDVLTWIWTKGNVTFKDIGTYYNSLKINAALITWYTNSTKVPKSTCSSNCEPGQIRHVKGSYSCCYDCIDCSEGTFQNNTVDLQCTNCPDGQWSLPRSTNCTLATYYFLSWNSYQALGLVLLAILMLTCHGVTGLLFLYHHGSALVRAAGGPLSALTLIGSMGSCASIILFLGQPGDLTCRLQQPVHVVFSTVTLSTFLAITLQIVCVTEFPEEAPSYLEILRGVGSGMVVLACCGVQAGLCGWFIQASQTLSSYLNSINVNFLTSFLRCPMEPMLGPGLMVGFNCLLALVCFMSTFMVKKPPNQYNLARDITFSTLFYCVVWVVFIPIYTGLDDKSKSLAEMTAILFGNVGIGVAYFLPKCHLLLIKPDLNTEDYFRTYLEASPIPPEKDQDKQQ